MSETLQRALAKALKKRALAFITYRRARPRFPMFQAAVAFGGGLLLEYRVWHPPYLLLGSALLLCAAAFYFELRAARPWLARATLLAALAAASTGRTAGLGRRTGRNPHRLGLPRRCLAHHCARRPSRVH